MADTQTLLLAVDGWTQWPADAAFTASNMSNYEVIVRVADVEPTSLTDGHRLLPMRSMSRLAAGTHWAYTRHSGVYIAFTPDD